MSGDGSQQEHIVETEKTISELQTTISILSKMLTQSYEIVDELRACNFHLRTSKAQLEALTQRNCDLETSNAAIREIVAELIEDAPEDQQSVPCAVVWPWVVLQAARDPNAASSAPPTTASRSAAATTYAVPGTSSSSQVFAGPSSGTSVATATTPSSSQGAAAAPPRSAPPISAERREALSEDLITAAERGDARRIRDLAAQGANLEYKGGGSKETALHLAAEEGHLDALSALIQLGADLEAKREDGSTPLHLAACYDKVECVRELLSAGADVNARDNIGGTPLHDAASNASPAVISALIAAGADRRARDDEGRTPRDRASDDAVRAML